MPPEVTMPNMSLSRLDVRSLVEANGADVAARMIDADFRAGNLDPARQSLRALAEGILSEETVSRWGNNEGGFQFLSEANEPVTVAAFINTLGGLSYAAARMGYEGAAFVGDQLVTVEPTKRIMGGLELIPDLAEVPDKDVIEGEEIPSAGTSENYIQVPATVKGGYAGAVTREMVIMDDTAALVRMFKEGVGYRVRMRREIRTLKVVLGITNNYKRNGTATNTYLTSGAYINTKASNELVDFSNIEAAEVLLSAILGPKSGVPIVMGADTLLVSPAKRVTALRLTGASDVQVRTQSSTVITQAENAMKHYGGRVFVSPLVTSLLTAASVSNPEKVWICGDTRKAFAYKEAWGFSMVAGPGNARREIVAEFIGSERGVCAAVEPRAVVKSTA